LFINKLKNPNQVYQNTETQYLAAGGGGGNIFTVRNIVLIQRFIVT
jgi:hypothetical protein